MSPESPDTLPLAASAPDVVGPHRQQMIYWRELQQLKAASVCTRLHRDSLARWVTRLGMLKAVASSGTIAAWAIWQQYAFLWGLIIAATQVADALKDVFPFVQRHKAASGLTVALEHLFIDAQFEWENVYSGLLANKDIMERLRRLRRLRLEIEQKHFPGGFAPSSALIALAEQESNVYFGTIYESGELE